MTEEKARKCDCDSYKERMSHLNSFITLEFFRNGRVYENPPFEYCPWCAGKVEKYPRS